MTKSVRLPRLLAISSIFLAIIPCRAQDGEHPQPSPPSYAGTEYKCISALERGATHATRGSRWSLKSRDLPSGLALGAATEVAAAFTTTASGCFVREVQVQDGVGSTGALSFALNLRPALRIARAEPALRPLGVQLTSSRRGRADLERPIPPLSGFDGEGDKVEIALTTAPAPPAAEISSGSSSVPIPQNQPPDCEASTKTDCRNNFEASAHLGIAIDTFASDNTLTYLNPNAATSTKERFSAGFSFAYRLAGQPVDAPSNTFSRPQLWVYGETLHGVRSTEFDCTANQLFCTNEGFVVPPNPQQPFFAILRAASSLEAFAGMRFEFLTMQGRQLPPANLYLKGQVGFLKVSGRPDDVVDVHHAGLGLVATKGRFQDSYIEAGFGRTDLFHNKSKDRWKLDGQLNIDIGRGVSFYAQMVVDADAGFGSDSVQSYLGFDFDLKTVARCWFRKECD